MGDFNFWNRDEFVCIKDEFGFFSITIAPFENQPKIKHLSRYKICIQYNNGEKQDRNPAYCNYLIQNKETFLYDPVFWNPPQKYKPKYKAEYNSEPLLIYEAHVGIASEKLEVATYKNFTYDVLDRIKKNGYNSIQLMAIMEHAYYGSFGYHVTNFFACSSRFGTPCDLKELIDRAHSLGLKVLIDLVHSHASTNVFDGINLLDGSDYLYFHAGEKGNHKLWDSKCFNYSLYETKRFLLSNLMLWMEEYGFDGFRFDGITSMLYINHGIGYAFSNGYDEYFNDNVDEDAVVYLMLANHLIKKINKVSHFY